MKTVIETAHALADHLNNIVDYRVNWWDAATEIAYDYCPDSFYDPVDRRDRWILTDGYQTVAVRFDYDAQRWNVEL